MGWWNASGKKAIVGDLPLDALGDAAKTVVKHYEAAFGRRPTIAEWEALLQLALGHDEDAYRAASDGVPVDVRIVTKESTS
jgi:hypothetical protein